MRGYRLFTVATIRAHRMRTLTTAMGALKPQVTRQVEVSLKLRFAFD
jgi:hypothetical protein